MSGARSEEGRGSEKEPQHKLWKARAEALLPEHHRRKAAPKPVCVLRRGRWQKSLQGAAVFLSKEQARLFIEGEGAKLEDSIRVRSVMRRMCR